MPSRKAGAWKGSISGVGESVLAWNAVGSGAENRDVSSMEGLLVFERGHGRSHRTVSLAYGLTIRS